jgi:hypothetical protein
MITRERKTMILWLSVFFGFWIFIFALVYSGLTPSSNPSKFYYDHVNLLPSIYSSYVNEKGKITKGTTVKELLGKDGLLLSEEGRSVDFVSDGEQKISVVYTPDNGGIIEFSPKQVFEGEQSYINFTVRPFDEALDASILLFNDGRICSGEEFILGKQGKNGLPVIKKNPSYLKSWSGCIDSLNIPGNNIQAKVSK